MHVFALALFIAIALFWLIYGIRVALGALQLPWIKDVPPASDANYPAISILFAARDEEEKLPAALASLLALDYPRFEIVAVDDRSSDSTGQILNDAARTSDRVRVVRIAELPAAWLGKPHALQKAYEASSGEWLVFTDADVRFAPDLLRRAVTIARGRAWDHLTLLCHIETAAFWERVIVTFFGLGFHLVADPHRASDPKSSRYVGVGAFQLVRRSAYEASGTHRRLAMEVVDDMKLGKIIKQAGFRSGLAVAQDFLIVRWHSGLGNLVRGVTKNFFAGVGYSVPMVGVSLVGMFLLDVLPFAAVFIGTGWIQILAAAAATIAVGFHAGVAYVLRISPFYALTHPLGALIFSYMLVRSTAVTLRDGGVTWRGTFYPLDELKRGLA